MARALKDRIVDAEIRGSQALADANEAKERGALKTAERLYDKAQFWLDCYNKLAGNA